MSGRGLHVSGRWTVGEIKKNKTDTIRVDRLLFNGIPYVSIQVISCYEDKAKTQKPLGKPISLMLERIDGLIQALENAKDWTSQDGTPPYPP